MSTHRTWKTSRRGEQRPPVSSSTTSSAAGGDFLSSSASDLSHKLDFLDSVLARPVGDDSTKDEKGIQQPPQQPQPQQTSERLRSEDVDPILELVNGRHYDKISTGAGVGAGGGLSSKDKSNTPQVMRTAIDDAVNTNNNKNDNNDNNNSSKKIGLLNSSSSTGSGVNKKKTNNNDEPLFASELPSGVVSRASTSSLRRSEKSDDKHPSSNRSHTTPTKNLQVVSSTKSSGGGGGSATENPTIKKGPQPLEGGGAAAAAVDGDNTQEMMPPIPYLGTEQQDDDSLSQITSSIASQSFYDSMFGGSSSRGSQPARQKKRSMATSENSYADTLDEIADMLHHPTTDSQPQQPPHNKSSGGNHNGPPYRNNTNRHNFQQHRPTTTAPFDDLYNRPASERYNEYHYHKNSTTSSRPQTIMAALTMIISKVDPAFSKLRLQVRYIQSRIVNYRSNIDMTNNKSKKTDGEEATSSSHGGGSANEKDYYGMLMSSASQQSSTGGPRRMTRAQRRQYHINTAITLIVVLIGMTMILVALRVAMSSIPRRPQTKSGGTSNNNNNNIRGGMAHGGMAHGGMAHGGMAGGYHPNNPAVDAADVAVADSGGGGSVKDSGFSHSEHIGVPIPEIFDNLADTDVPPLRGVDVPFFWHIPRTGGGTMNDILGGCLYLTLASDAGGNGSGSENDSLKVTKFPKHFSYVNVDTSSPEGIERARKLGLAESGLADVVVGTLLHQVSTVFTEENKGRMFTMFRHPVDRAVSLFHFVQDTHWRNRETFQKELSSLTIEEYFKGGLAENNWMTRYLTNELTKGQLTTEDLSKAKEILRRKVLVGLLNEKGESFARFEKYFGWKLKSDSEKDCHEKKLQWAWPLKHRHDDVDEGSPLWDLIVAHNIYDMELYEYAEVLFHEQRTIFDRMEYINKGVIPKT